MAMEKEKKTDGEQDSEKERDFILWYVCTPPPSSYPYVSDGV